MRTHPVTGKQVPWEFLRPGHSCSVISASPNALFYRSYCVAFYDLIEDRGVSLFGGIRPGCWLSLISANGLLMFPEASSGCTCSFPLRSTVVMKHKPVKRPKDWTMFVTHGAMTPVQHLAINFGAPADMKDDDGIMWFSYPRPRSAYGMKFSLKEEIVQGMGYFSQDFKDERKQKTYKPWLIASGCLGLLKCEVPLINDLWDDSPGTYTVRLGFSAPSVDRSGERVFDIMLQGEVVSKKLDIIKETGDPNKALIEEFKGIKVDDNLVVELVPKALSPTMTQAPIINFIEIIRDDVAEVDTAQTIRVLDNGEAQSMLASAQKELEEGNKEAALEKFHSVFDAASSLVHRKQALKGMAAIGDFSSISRIAVYCNKPSSNVWDYYEVPDPELRTDALKVYEAITMNMKEIDEQKAVRMQEHITALTKKPDKVK